MKLTPLLLGTGILLSATAYAANPASDSGSNYTNPWGPNNPQNSATSGFAPWIFGMSQPQSPAPSPYPFFIDTKTGAFCINVTDDDGYDAAWVTFTGDGQIDVNQSYTTDVLFTPPGNYSQSGTPTEGIQFIAQSPRVPPNPRYDKFGHQVFGLYLVPTAPGVYKFSLGIHNTLSDEDPNQWISLPWNFTGTLKKPMKVHIDFKQLVSGSWKLELRSPGKDSLVYSSANYGPLWNISTGIDGVQIFTSQGNATPGGRLEWKNMSVK